MLKQRLSRLFLTLIHMETPWLSPFFQHLLITAAIGLIIGLEREFNTHGEKAHIGGIRTFTMVALLGYLAGALATRSLLWVIPATIAGFFVLLTIVYYFQVKQGRFGLTTELSMITTLLMGMAVAFGLVLESLAMVVVMTTLLSVKEQVHGIIRQITQEELFAFIKFIILALLVLPMLPDEAFGPENLINIRDLGWIVVIVLSISFAGYLLLKFGELKRGILLTAVVGGLFSSTMVAWVFSARSREKPQLSAAYSAGVIVSSSVMFVRVFVLSLIFYHPVAKQLLIPMLLLLGVSLFVVYWVFRQQHTDGDKPLLKTGNPLDIQNAAFFVVLYVTISIGMYYAQQWLGQTGAYVSGAAAGIADIDAITISTVKWAAHDVQRSAIAANIVVMAVLSNTVFKTALSIARGSEALRRWVLAGFGVVLIAGAVWLVFRLL